MHRNRPTHEALFVLVGVITLNLADKTHLLTPGDYVNIPPGTAHGYTFAYHLGKLLSWSFGGNAADAYAQLGKPYSGTVYEESTQPINWELLDSSVDTEIIPPLPLLSMNMVPSSRPPTILSASILIEFEAQDD